MLSQIKITGATSAKASIDIEGMIGVPEQWQFEEPGQRVATYEKFKDRLEAIGQIKSGEITVNIRSTGGNVNDALLIHDALTALDATIITRCYGYVASAATIIAQAASGGAREISSNSLYLIHRSISAVEGNSNDLYQTIDLLSKTDQRIANIYAARSGRDADSFALMMDQNNGNGRWLSPDEALEAALVDRIIESAVVTNDVVKMVKELGLPEIPKEYLTPKNSDMNRKWSAILKVLGITKKQGEVLDEMELDLIEKELVDSGEKIENLQNSHADQMDSLKNKIAELETEKARHSAAPSKTKPKQDPSANELKRTSNEMAYERDVKRFK